MASRLTVVLGCGEFGRKGGSLESKAATHNVLKTYLAKGYSEMDTALMYGKSQDHIGQYIMEHDKADMKIATKCNPWGSNSLKYDSIMHQMGCCLSSLHSSSVDMLYIHVPDHTTPMEETLHAYNQLHQEGKFKELGLSNYASWQVMDIYHICQRNGWVLPSVYQGMYNAITRGVEQELFPCLRHLGMRFYAYNPTACGLLTGRYKLSDADSANNELSKTRFFIDPKWSPLYRERYWRESTFQGVDLVSSALEECYRVGSVSLLSAAFRWLNHHSAMSPEYGDGIIVGVSKEEQLVQNLDALSEGPLDQRVVEAFEQAWQLDKPHSSPYFR